MEITKAIMEQMLLCAAKKMEEQVSYLCEIDSAFGDGDHGITIHKIAALLAEKAKQLHEKSFSDFFFDLGEAVMAVNGGSAGPLYGTMLAGMGIHLADETVLDTHALKKVYAGMLEELQDITTATVGDKTMMDALIPAVLAAKAAQGDVKEILFAAAQAGQRGAKESENYISKFGRAKSYKEQTIGTPDAGAVSTSLFLEGLAEGYKPV